MLKAGRLVTFAACAIVCGIGESRAAQRGAIDDVLDAYQENIDAIPFGTVDFLFRVGKAASMTETLAGRMDVTAEAKCRWIFDGEIERRELNYPLELSQRYRKSNPDGTISVSYVSKHLVYNNRGMAQFYPVDKQLILQDHGPSSFVEGVSLFGMGVSGATDRDRLPELVRMTQTRVPGGVVTVTGPTSQKDRLVYEVTLSVRDAKRKQEFVLDADRGFFPVEIKFTNDDGVLQEWTVVEEMLPLSRSRWLPKRVVRQSTGGASFEILVVSSDFDTRPPSSAFEFEAPPGTIVSNGLLKTSHRVPPGKAERISLADVTAKLPSKRQDETADPRLLIAPPPPSRTHTGWLLVGGTLVGLGLLGFWLVRRRSIQ